MRATVYLYGCWCTGKVPSLSILYTPLLLPLPVFQRSVAINGVPLVRRRCARITSAAGWGGRASEQSEVRRSVIASRGAARVRGRQGVDRLLVCFRAKRKTTSGAITSETNLQKVLWSLVPLCDAADRLASCMLWGKPLFVRRLTSAMHTHLLYARHLSS